MAALYLFGMLHRLREADLFGQSSPWTAAREKDVEKALAQLKRKREKLREALDQIERRQQAHVGSKPPKRIASTTDPDARSMKDKQGRSKPNVNTQLAVDAAYRRDRGGGRERRGG